MPILASALAGSMMAVAAPPEASPSQAIAPIAMEGHAAREPRWAFSTTPFPLIYLGAKAELSHTPGPIDQYAVVATGLSWHGKDVYDPRETEPRALASYAVASRGLLPFLEARAGYGLNVGSSRLYLAGHYVGSNAEASSAAWLAKQSTPPAGFDNHYDPEALLGGGPLVLVGPHLDVDHTDDSAFPTSGFLLKSAADFGPSWLGNRTRSGAAQDIAVLQARASQFFPAGKDTTVVVSGLGGYGVGKLPVYSRFSAGGKDYLRGYVRDRFSGDRMLVGSAEFRHLAWPSLIPLGNLGFSYHAFLDAGRVWETSCSTCQDGGPQPIPFPGDLRAGAGVGIGILTGRRTLLQLDLAVGSEGLVWVPILGLFASPLIPVFGLSLSETW